MSDPQEQTNTGQQNINHTERQGHSQPSATSGAHARPVSQAITVHASPVSQATTVRDSYGLEDLGLRGRHSPTESAANNASRTNVIEETSPSHVKLANKLASCQVPGAKPAPHVHASLSHVAPNIPNALSSFLLVYDTAGRTSGTKDMSSCATEEQSTQTDPTLPLLRHLATTSALQEKLQEIALLLGTPQHIRGMKKLNDGVFAFKWIPEFESLRAHVLNSGYAEIVAGTGSIVQERKPDEYTYLRSAVLLLHRTALHTSEEEVHILQFIPIDKKTQEEIRSHIQGIDPAVQAPNDTGENMKILARSRGIENPKIRGEVSLPLQPDSLCLAFQNAQYEITPQLVPFLLVPRVVSKASLE
ncbi:hypothetical protein PSPO01_16450 [Paraphaeosphaeria sporulosa]